MNNNIWLTVFMSVMLVFGADSVVEAAAIPKGTPLPSVRSRDWSVLHVRRVLHTFAYGGLATEAQIATWATMPPASAVAEMLTFASANDKLSPVDPLKPLDSSTKPHCASLEELQNFWGGSSPTNPIADINRTLYRTLSDDAAPQLISGNLERTWIQSISTRGCNPFLHKVAFYLTNYQAAISLHKVRPALIRDYYNQIIAALIGGQSIDQILGTAAVSAAFARAYGHQFNVFRNATETPIVNDDFAREFFQLLFRIQGTSENPDYHENTTIEHMAWLLTGMNLDRQTNAFGSVNSNDWYIAPLNFDDHVDETGRNINNHTNHYHSSLGISSCLEILHANICGATPEDKVVALASTALRHTESLDNMPIILIDFFADDNLSEVKKTALRSAWVAAKGNLLDFLRNYASSTVFHAADTFKYQTAFDRNLSIRNYNTLTNEENFVRPDSDLPRARMEQQSAEVFEPLHDVFGGQTGLQAATNRYIFKRAFDANVNSSNVLRRTTQSYSLDGNPNGVNEYTWVKNWGAIIPKNASGEHVVSEVATWLWNRFIIDGGKNFDLVARAQVQAMLATGGDFGYIVDPLHPGTVYSSADIAGGNSAAASVNATNAATVMDLSSSIGNDRIGVAINFITMMPYTFVLGGS